MSGEKNSEIVWSPETTGLGIEMTEDRRQIVASVQALCDKFDDNYWLERDRTHSYPHDFVAEIQKGGWLGIALPVEYGGAGLGVIEAALLMQTIASSAGVMAACSSIHVNIFGPKAIVAAGTERQKKRFLPRLINGEDKTCFGVTEPDAGLDTTRITTRARYENGTYYITGQKVWTTTAQVANKIFLLARTSPYDPARPTAGITLFYTDLDRKYVDVREIEKLGRAAIDSNVTIYNDLPVPEEDRIGAEGEGFRLLLGSLNQERILVAAESIGIGRRALAKATQYAKERVVFGRQIGKNQGIQHPLAKCWMDLEAADLMMWKSAELSDRNEPCGAWANSSKYLASEAAFRACETAILTLGGMGYAKEYHVERYFREIMLPRIAPVSREMIMSFVAERVLGLPKSY